jgi:hypothetical protein
VEIVWRPQADEAARRAKMHRHWLPTRQQTADVRQCPAALAIPKHEAIGSIVGHLDVFHGIEIKAPGSPWGIHRADLPTPHIVADHSGHRIDHDSLVPSIGQVLLECAIGAIRVADEHPEATVEEFIKL